MSFDVAHDRQVRLAAFEWLNLQKTARGEVLRRDLLEQGFDFNGLRIPIVGPQGIFKPRALSAVPLSITTTPGGPYDDDLRDGGSVINYRYRGTDANHHENVGLRTAMQTQTPLIYCYRAMPGRYLVSYPVFVCHDDPSDLTFSIQLDDDLALKRYLSTGAGIPIEEAPSTLHRQYVTVSAKRRLHQAAFRERVLSAYETRCALCRLRHGALLDAAHIIPDGEPGGEPEVSNGLALCKIHHAAFDLDYIGVSPKFQIEVRGDLLRETDGPMLQHGIKAMHGENIILPRSRKDRPTRDRLEVRFEKFRRANSS
jgi:putative restriction endonuclease